MFLTLYHAVKIRGKNHRGEKGCTAVGARFNFCPTANEKGKREHGGGKEEKNRIPAQSVVEPFGSAIKAGGRIGKEKERKKFSYSLLLVREEK